MCMTAMSDKRRHGACTHSWKKETKYISIILIVSFISIILIVSFISIIFVIKFKVKSLKIWNI